MALLILGLQLFTNLDNSWRLKPRISLFLMGRKGYFFLCRCNTCPPLVFFSGNPLPAFEQDIRTCSFHAYFYQTSPEHHALFLGQPSYETPRTHLWRRNLPVRNPLIKADKGITAAHPSILEKANMPNGRIQLEVFIAYADPGAFTIGMILALCCIMKWTPYKSCSTSRCMLFLYVYRVISMSFVQAPRRVFLILAMQSHREGRVTKETR